ncbi:hypothetical protein HRbin36_00629 [bacterium HR36]|nr:hypothetical protein HRbin36_00629 [bacterium HR36]
MYREWKIAVLGVACLLGSLLAAAPAQADHWRHRPRGTVLGFSVGVGAPTVVYTAPVVVYDSLAPIVVRPAAPVIIDPWCPPPVPVYYPSRVTGVFIGSPGFGFYYERWR